MLERNLSLWRTWRLVLGKTQWQEKFQADLETKMRELIQPQVENALQLLETDLRGLWPQLQDTMENQFKGDSRVQLNQTIPDFARQRRELLQSIELTLVERIAGRGMEAQLERMFRETANWLRVPAGVAAAGGIVTLIAAMSSAAVADVTGIVAASALVAGTFVALGRRRKILSGISPTDGSETPGIGRLDRATIAACNRSLLRRDRFGLFAIARLLRLGAQALRPVA